MRFNRFPLSVALILPFTSLLGGCVIVTETSSSGGTGGSSTTTAGTAGAGGSIAGAAGTSMGGSGGSSMGGTGGTGGTGGSSTKPTMDDTCPGEPVALEIGNSTTIKGTLVGKADDFTTFCADMNPDGGAPDVVYELDVPDTATVTLDLKATGFIPAMSIRKTECMSRVGGDQCLTLGTGDVLAKLSLDAGKYWVVIDSADQNVGDFTLDVTFAAPACGDGVINPGEQCDPQPPANDDGCINPGLANGCMFGEPPPDPKVVSCPGGLITIGQGDSFIVGPFNNGSGMSQNINLKDDPQGNSTGPCPSFAWGPEDVFQIMPTGDGHLSITIGHTDDGMTAYCADPMNTCGDFIIYLREGSCDNSGTQLSCDDVDEANNLEVLNVQADVTANTPYWFIVDSYQDAPMNPMFGPYTGAYYVQVSLQ